MTIKRYLSLTCVITAFLIFSATEFVFTQSSPPLPKVLTAVAPTFVPFVFGKTGTNIVKVKVLIDTTGNVTSAQITEVSELRTRSVEDTAKRWKFTSASENSESREAELTFIFSILPKDSPPDQLTTVYNAPYQIEVRHEVFEPQTFSDPPLYSPKESKRKKKRPK